MRELSRFRLLGIPIVLTTTCPWGVLVYVYQKFNFFMAVLVNLTESCIFSTYLREASVPDD